MTKTQCQNKVVITSSSGSFEFGNTGISSPCKGSKTYNRTKIFNIKPSTTSNITLKGYAEGSLSWGVSLISANKYNIGLSGILIFDARYRTLSGRAANIRCSGKGILTDAKG